MSLHPNPAVDLAASLVLEDGRRWGEAAVDVQWEDLRAALDAASATPYHYLTRARGYSKTSDLAVVNTAAMLDQLAPGSRVYALAADRDQGRLLVDSIAGFASRTPGLGDALDIAGYRVTAKRSGCMLEVLAADASSAYGLRPAFLTVDELAQWKATTEPRQLWEATTSAMAKVNGSRLVVLTSAGDPAHWSYRVLEHARSDAMWRTHEVAGPPPWVDPRRLEEQRRRLPESSFHRLFLNEWTAAEDRLTDIDDLRACVILDGPLPPASGRSYIIGVDLGVRNDRSVAAVCHVERIVRPQAREAESELIGQRVFLDRMEVWEGSAARPVPLDDVREWIEQATRTYRPARVVMDPWQAIGMAQQMQQRRVMVEEFSFSQQSVGRLALTLYRLLKDRALALPPDEALLDELANVRLRETAPGVLRMDHDPDRHDDRAMALALAATTLLETPAGYGRLRCR